jgi:hypothetical protein
VCGETGEVGKPALLRGIEVHVVGEFPIGALFSEKPKEPKHKSSPMLQVLDPSDG